MENVNSRKIFSTFFHLMSLITSHDWKNRDRLQYKTIKYMYSNC